MGKIKFRAWNIQEKRMMFEDDFANEQIVLNFNGNIFKIFINEHNEIDYKVITENFVIMEFVGVEDFDGKEVYEGDVVKFEHRENMDISQDDDDILIFSNEAQISQVKSKGKVEGNFSDYQLWLIEWAMDDDYEFEVIGNIYENPELCK